MEVLSIDNVVRYFYRVLKLALIALIIVLVIFGSYLWFVYRSTLPMTHTTKEEQELNLRVMYNISDDYSSVTFMLINYGKPVKLERILVYAYPEETVVYSHKCSLFIERRAIITLPLDLWDKQYKVIFIFDKGRIIVIVP